MKNHSIFTAAKIAEKIAEIGSGRRGKSKILVQKSGVLNAYGEQTPLNRLLSFFAHRVFSPT
jgi:hypothetical protein